jgi:hypothetical protein
VSTNSIERNSRSRVLSGATALFDCLASARLSTVVGESNGLIVVITDGEGSGVPVAQEAKGIQ